MLCTHLAEHTGEDTVTKRAVLVEDLVADVPLSQVFSLIVITTISVKATHSCGHISQLGFSRQPGSIDDHSPYTLPAYRPATFLMWFWITEVWMRVSYAICCVRVSSSVRESRKTQ